MKSYTILIFLLFAMALPSCDDQFEEINTSPNDVTDIDDEYLFAQAVMLTIRGDANNYLQFPFASQYAHIYVATSTARYIDTYQDNFTSAEYRYLFEYFYYGPIRHIKETLRFTEAGGKKENEVRHAMAQVISIFNFLRLADSFGAVPFEDGGYGQKGILYPAYTGVDVIYADMISTLKEALELLKVADPKKAYPDADPLFENDLNKWVKFANSLRFRMAMRMRFVEPQTASAIIQDCLTNPLIDSNADNAWRENYDSDVGEFQSPTFSIYNYWQWKMSEKFVETLKSTDDPRLKIFVEPNQFGEYIGIPNGLNDEAFGQWNWANTCNPSAQLIGKSAPSYLMSSAETWLLRAEAALFNIIDGDANSLYRQGIQLALEQWNVPQQEIESYLADPVHGNLSGSQEEQFEQICTQLWIAYMPDAHEGWCNIRRTGYPTIARRTGPNMEQGSSEGRLPKRLKYPSAELNINRENYLKALELQGADEITTALWWDVRD